MPIRTRKNIRRTNKKSLLKGGSNKKRLINSERELQGLSNEQYHTPSASPSNTLMNPNFEISENNIEVGNTEELNNEAKNHNGYYNFGDDDNFVVSQPYGDEVRVTLNKDEVLYGLNMNVITFDSNIKETKTFTPRSKIAGEELFIKKYIAKDTGTIVFDFDKNDPSDYVKESIVIVPLNRTTNSFVIRDPKNIIAYTGNISIHLEFHTTGIRSSKENITFTKLKLNNKSDIGYVYVVMDNYEIIGGEDTQEDTQKTKIKNEHFICAAVPNNGLKLEKLYFPSLGFKSTKEYIIVKAPSLIFRTSNNFSFKQLEFLEKFKTNLF